MERIVKQNNTLTGNSAHSKPSAPSGASAKYRTMIFMLLNKLEDACIEIIEGNDHTCFGERDAELRGTIVVHDESFYQDVIRDGSIGGAEAFIDGKWTSPDLTAVVEVMARNQWQLDQIEQRVRWFSKIKRLFQKRQDSNTEQGSKRNILAHYDLGNELYSRFLDPAMQYSCAIYSEDALSLDLAQQLKMKTICERLDLTDRDHVLEIGTGWGGQAIYMAQNYGCRVTTTTISDAQHEYVRAKIEALGLDKQITLLKKDYRKLTGRFDKLVSVEMIEAVGHEYLSTFFRQCSDLLKPHGKMLIQSITIADNRYETYRQNMDFIQKYIFPGGCLPSVAVMTQQLAKQTDLVVDEIHDIGLHYARTLHDWRVTFEQQWHQLIELGYSDTFKRLWLFYLCYCEGAFLQRAVSTHHLVARKPRFRGQNDETILDY